MKCGISLAVEEKIVMDSIPECVTQEYNSENIVYLT